jgi:beta-lactamase superfamily II metal-dependent hydrolase
VSKKLILKIASVGVLLVGVYGYTRIEQTKPIGFHITSLDIGQGDSELIQFRDGEKMLVDCGKDGRITLFFCYAILIRCSISDI